MFSLFKRRSPLSARELFEAELTRRGIAFAIDPSSQRHRVNGPNGELLVCLDNLQRDLAHDGDLGRVTRFVDTVLASGGRERLDVSLDRIYWGLEPSDHVEKADMLAPLSDRVDRVLQHLSPDASALTWLTPDLLAENNWSRAEAEEAGFKNLARELAAAKVEFSEIDGVRLGYLVTQLPLKSSLFLAPNLRAIVEPALGWPLLAVAPHRDFLYLWSAAHREFVDRIGHVVVREYREGSYPLSAEVWSINDSGIKAIGAFPTAAPTD